MTTTATTPPYYLGAEVAHYTRDDHSHETPGGFLNCEECKEALRAPPAPIIEREPRAILAGVRVTGPSARRVRQAIEVLGVTAIKEYHANPPYVAVLEGMLPMPFPEKPKDQDALYAEWQTKLEAASMPLYDDHGHPVPPAVAIIDVPLHVRPSSQLVMVNRDAGEMAVPGGCGEPHRLEQGVLHCCFTCFKAALGSDWAIERS
ncbi:MAG: hypothetical protein ABSC13_06285 [Dehalococcoidia bacterium]|jgi:hypothetical protein